ncbi:MULTISPECIES: SIR2 family NAD-dependent protein deacylase [Pseudomonas]|uniref:NAD-dependent protein deacylase n=1 Tax=Pseudomonas rhodesiae TaxID=76760 RepID=A0A8I1E8J7_9PSED|nr:MULTISPECIES: NAD-dependent deacylase [Pseudomonas]MBI6603966.1 NAD-dependent deacylase [Pseudomonas sp. S4_EA_1b]MBI6626754.1 NAD-dependent deacylase [Pseudomonas rhodesiae]QYM67119.1 NAD-dependent deacylase [Pseudomonas sp. So3.2b]RTY78777.1 NAD-dependent deacylase [Pseudomonas veronii]
MQLSDQQLKTLRSASYIVIFSGAGVSAESGIATFRDSLSGLWERFDPADLATPEAFLRDPELVWGWYEWRRGQGLEAQPNSAHKAIAALAARVAKLTVITQNVDDLHERAGSSGVVHLHGSLNEPRCFACNKPYRETVILPALLTSGERIEPPRCLQCNGKVRPGVVWFGESLPDVALLAAYDAARHCDLLLSIGTSGLVQPAARIPQVALDNGATVVHINTQPVTKLHDREFSLVGLAGEVLPELLEQAFKT